MQKILDLPTALDMVQNGSENGETWTRYTDGEDDFMATYNPETGEARYFLIGPAPLNA